jgi:metallophosphoesterase (TIGR03767 family)
LVKLTRRNLFRSGAVAGGVAAVGAVPAAVEGAAVAPTTAAASLVPVATAATAGVTLVKNPVAGAGGYRSVITSAGEPHVVRTELGVAANAGRTPVAMIAFAQLSDVHVVDAQSPLRLEFSDRLDDQPLPQTLFSSAYRAHEMLSGQIADAMVREINDIGAGPVTGRTLDLAIQTGDNSDNSQLNEVRWNIQLLNGASSVRVDSGSLSKWEGVADATALYYDPAYYHPHGTPTGKTQDVYRKRYGFPVVPGLLDAARAPFPAEGLDMPWFACFGNHDGLVQGNFPQNLQLSLLSTGALKIMSTPAGLSPAELINSLMSGDLLGIVQSLALTPAVRLVTPDTNRRLLTRKQVVEQHFVNGDGQGFTAENRSKGTAYYTFDRGTNVRFIVLDTVNPNGYSDGSIDKAQFAWLEAVLNSSAGKAVVVCSHHTSWTMANTLIAVGGELEFRISGAKVLERLLSHHEVVAWVNGHTHKNTVLAHTRPEGGGLWEINTASHIDWPQQSRLIEVCDNGDGTLSIFATMVDHAGPVSGNTSSSVQLAGLGRELAANEPQNRTDSGRGQVNDRNVELLIDKPF